MDFIEEIFEISSTVGDTIDAPTPITEGTYNLTDNGIEFYEFDALAGQMEFYLAADAGTQDLNLILYNDLGQALAIDNTAVGDATLSRFITAPGTYTLLVETTQFRSSPPDGLSIGYTLSLDLPDENPLEANDTMAGASDISDGDNDFLGFGPDWHKITTGTGLLDLSLSNITTDEPVFDDLEMILYNAAGNAVARDATPSGSNEDISYFVRQAGDYFVKIFPAADPNSVQNGVAMSYQISVDRPDVAPAADNDVFETAPTLDDGTYSQYGSYDDWFKIESPSGFLNLTLTEGPQDATTLADLNMVLYNAEGVAIATDSTPNGGNEEITALLPSDGDYYVRVFSAAFPNGTPSGFHLSYNLTIDKPEASAGEANDIFEGATQITAGDYVGYGSKVDWLKITSPSGYINITMTEGAQDETTLSDLNLTLYNSDGVAIASDDDSTGGNEEITTLLPSDGEYFLKINSALYPDGAPNGANLSYNLNVALPVVDTHGGDDPSELPENATMLGDGQTEVSGRGVDWFRLSTGPGTVDITMTPTGDDPLDLNMEIYTLDGEAIASGFTETAEMVSFVSRLSQDFLVKVYWAPFQDGAPNGVNLTYTLDVDLPKNTWSKQLDFGPVRGASIATYDIDNDGKDEIFVGTSKKLDSEGNEILPAGLIVLEDDGTVKWTTTFAAYDGVDFNSGKTYQTSSISTAPIFTDINGDGQIDILVGTGADGEAEFNAVGQPGDLGGIHAVDRDGNHLWSHFTRDKFGTADLGGEEGVTEVDPDGRSDGVLGAPRVFDIDGDGVREVLYLAWDHYLYALDGRTGEVDFETVVHDTAGASPAVADLNGDGIFEIIAPSDISENAAAGIHTQGGILHVMNNYGQQNVDGWNTQVQNSVYSTFRGAFDEQSLWSTPQVVDLDRNGTPELVLGTGDFFKDGRGEYVKVYNADGSLRLTLPTTGRTLANVVIADLDGDGSSEILTATTQGHIHAFTAGGQEIFNTEVLPYNEATIAGIEQDNPIARSPIAVDLDNDGDLEILVSVGSQMVVLDSNGDQITNLEDQDRTFFSYSGSPVARDIDGDGRLDLISGGTTDAADQAVVFRFENIVDVVSDNYRTAAYQGDQSLHEIQNFVDRFYSTILGRDADAGGRNGWTDLLHTGVRSGADVARGFINSGEFINQGNSNEEYVNILYSAFFDRPADTGGFNAWMSVLNGGGERGDVLEGFIGSREFSNLATKFGIKAQASFGDVDDSAVIFGDSDADSSILRGGAGDNIIYDAGTSVTDGSDKEDIDVAGQVYRMYNAAFAREPGAAGFLGWYGALASGNQDIIDVANRFIISAEFNNTYGALNDAEFVELLYQNVLGRESDEGGRNAWLDFLDNGASRAQVVVGFSESGEFVRKTNPDLDKWMYTGERQWNDIIEGGAGNDTMNGGLGSDTFVFRNGQGGADTIHRFEPWDQLQLSNFGFSNGQDVLARMTQSGSDVLFAHAGQQITFVNTSMAEMQRVKMNVS